MDKENPLTPNRATNNRSVGPATGIARILKPSLNRILREYIGITIGVLITALALDMFLIPNRLAAGGVSGLSTVLHYKLGFPVGATMAVLNLLLFAIGTKVHGWKYGMKTVYGAFGLALAVDLMVPLTKYFMITNDAILGTLYGGILSGIGMGIVFRNGGNTGGTDIVAQIFQKYSNLGLGQLFLLVDGFVMLVAAGAFGLRLALYGMIAVIVMGRVIDYVQEGLSIEKAAFIMSEHTEEITSAILFELRRGATAIASRGCYSGKQRDTIFCVVERRQVEHLKRIVHSIDPKAFVIVSDVREVVGEGFKQFAA
ncbi:MAG: YitT family protein [Actinobacteria bacterium]|nr:YitT family protein [Actinomycetota bacterium]